MKCVLVLASVIALALATPLHPRDETPESRAQEGGKLWALLVAGSSSYYNYRHQADVCHAYQVIHSHGIPDENIIVMMYDDIANDPSNPTKGVIINHPDGNDVYKGVPKDYTGEAVTPQNFLNVLQGKKSAMNGIGSGRVLETGPNDRIFVYFSDHGATGLIAFPSDLLTAEQLNDAIKSMYKNKRYNKMVMYIEACESGSMFDGLLTDDLNVYVTTAASPDESSYACYYDDLRGTYLGDVYSVKWLEDSDAEVLSKESLKEQYSVVKKETTTSQVEQYGNLSLASMMVSEFQGSSSPKEAYSALPRVHLDAVSSREVPLAILRKKLEAAVDEDARKKIEDDIEMVQRNRQFLKDKVREIVKAVSSKEDVEEIDVFLTSKTPLKNRKCYESAILAFHKNCFDLSQNAYALTYARTISNLCEANYSAQTIRAAISKVCTHPKIVGIL